MNDMLKTAIKAVAAISMAAASLAAHAVGHRADLTIIDRTTGHELPVYWHEGRAYVVGRPGNEYQVSVRNVRGEDLLAIASVDGLNVMDGKPADPSQGGYIVSAWNTVDIRGWRKSLDETAAFYFTSLGDSYAGRTGRPANVGVIGVALFEGVRHANTRPAEAIAPSAPPSARSEKRLADNDAAAASEAPLATGHGRREESRVRYTSFVRSTTHPVETIAIYYDSYRNLVAQGVIPAYGHRRDPQPFPQGFTPDP